ncbi:lysophospholipid acyltransferase family protein [Desulfosarcina sp.]|uniref:lysophospholipid acyltransferase family protein n=1 Tax=Desulfosarcina sp. TaxID=2027861 RepID=UPI00356302F3
MQSDSIPAQKDLSRFLQKQPSIFLAKLLPFSLYRQYLSMAGFYYYGMNGGERRNVSKALKYVLGEKTGKIKFQSILIRTYFGIFEHYFEKMINAHKSLPEMMNYLKNRIAFSGKDLVEQITSQNKGCIFVTGHFGAVEYIPLYLAAHGYRASMILRYKTKALREALVDKSDSVDLELIDADNHNVFFKALGALKKGRILITMCDEIRSWQPCSKEHTRLFGRQIPKDRTLDLLYKRSRAPMCFGVVQRKKSGYELAVHPVADGEEACSACEASWTLLERYVYRNPDQWYQWSSFYPDFIRYMSSREDYDY